MDYFISPRVVGRNLEIHPLLVIFATMVGARIGGIEGIFLSIPFILVVRIILQKYLRHQRTAAVRNSCPQGLRMYL
jgi:predicted PurR-regulated permease PerM